MQIHHVPLHWWLFHIEQIWSGKDEKSEENKPPEMMGFGQHPGPEKMLVEGADARDVIAVAGESATLWAALLLLRMETGQVLKIFCPGHLPSLTPHDDRTDCSARLVTHVPRVAVSSSSDVLPNRSFSVSKLEKMTAGSPRAWFHTDSIHSESNICSRMVGCSFRKDVKEEN